MKNKYAFLIIGVVVLIMIIPVVKARVNIPSLMRSMHINTAKNKESSGDCAKLNPGYYNIEGIDSDNIINGYTVGKGSKYVNVNSQYINSIGVCRGNLKFIPTTDEELNFKNKKEFELNSGVFDVGENLDSGVYNVNAELGVGESIQINVISGKGDLTTIENIYINKKDLPKKIELKDSTQIQVMVKKDNVLGTDEIVNKKISFSLMD